jgi:hypothetical protein
MLHHMLSGFYYAPWLSVNGIREQGSQRLRQSLHHLACSVWAAPVIAHFDRMG